MVKYLLMRNEYMMLSCETQMNRRPTTGCAKNNWVPILFDFVRPDKRGLYRNDQDALEMQALVVQTTQFLSCQSSKGGERPFSMFDDLKKYPWVLRRLVSYESVRALKSAMQREVVTPALAMAKVIGDMRRERFERIEVRNVSAGKRYQRRK